MSTSFPQCFGLTALPLRRPPATVRKATPARKPAPGKRRVPVKGKVSDNGQALTGFTLQKQEQYNWCWLTVGSEVMRFFGQANGGKSQCEMANAVLGAAFPAGCPLKRTDKSKCCMYPVPVPKPKEPQPLQRAVEPGNDCCKGDARKASNVPGNLQCSLKASGYYLGAQRGKVSFDVVKNEITDGNPVGMCIAWLPAGRAGMHFVTIIGWDGDNQMIHVMDSDRTTDLENTKVYAAYPEHYNGSRKGEWYATYYTQAPKK